ncbi:uncharacterized protein LOC144547593 [Carex rostrata]
MVRLGPLEEKPSCSTGFGTASNIQTLVAAAEQRETQIETPSTEVQDNILLIVNNISTSNLEAKAKDFNEVLHEQYFPWFAQYTVMQRVSIEPNFHDLYLRFLDKVNSKALNKEILKATFMNCKVVLSSDLIKSNSEERSLLKNLGSWLGKFTIGRNQALRAKEIDPKSLIIEAYERGLMIAVIPFTSKILKPCLSSIAYRPPNPWTMGILSLLAEIYNLPNLKISLIFEIERLFRDLVVDLKEVKPSSLIKDRVREVEGNPDFSNNDITTVSPSPIVTEASIPVPGNQVELPLDVSTNPSHHSTGTRIQYNIPYNIIFAVFPDNVDPLIMPEQIPSPHGIPQMVPPAQAPSPSPSPFLLDQLLQIIPANYFRISPMINAVGDPQVPYFRIIEAAMDKSVKEIISPVIQRSVTIASRTTKELILKDYSVEPDDGVIFRAAHLMVGILAGSLAHVTCKKPLGEALTSNLRTMLQELDSNNDNNEKIIEILITDHLDLGCALIESMAKCKAVEIIDTDIAQSLAQLREQRDAAGSAFAQGLYSHVPDALRPKPAGQLANTQLRVYEEFNNVWCTPEAEILSGRPVGTKEDVTLSDTMPLSPDPAGFQDQVAVLFSEWCQLCDLPVVNDMTYSHYISQLQQNGLLKGDEITDRFFRVLTELSIAHSLVKEPAALGAVQNHTNEQISFFPIDSYAKLTVVILKYASVEQVPSKALLLMKLLLVTAKVIVKDAEEKKTDFNARPYFRLFVNWLLDIVSPDLDGANYEILTCFASAFLALQPLIVPSFSFAWLELLCHENFMPKILTCNSPEGWPHFQCLLVCLFKFVEPFLRKSQLPEPVVLLYKGILKMMVVLLLDFPEFLCDYHFSLCDVLPTTCVQLRNLILSAFPRNMTVPNPCTPKLKVDLLPEIQQAPRILSDVEGALKEKQMKSDIDEYLKTRPEGSSFLDELRQKLLLPQSEVSQAGMPYNVPLINSLVLYIGMQAIQQLQSNNTDIILVEAAMGIYQSLVKNLDTEGRYYLINAICNQLRYPNSHTLYFSSVLLSLWTKASSELIQEQIARVLLERRIVRWPYPWGLIITFMEITKNSQYNFWNQPFIRVAPDIEELFKSVARSWGVRPTGKALEDAHASAGVPDANN